MFRPLFILALLAISSTSFAQVSPTETTTDQVDHSKMDHSKMDHGSAHMPDDHANHDHPDATATIETREQNALISVDQPEIMEAIAAGGEPIVATVLGAVCDFCAKAMNKTFGKRKDVAAVYVDLDKKTLNLVLKPGAEMSDEDLRKYVKRSGYKVDAIARGPAVFAR